MLLVRELLLKISRHSIRNNILYKAKYMRTVALRTPRSFQLISVENKQHMDNSLNSNADAIIIDLEDSVDKDNKQKARIDAAKWLTTHSDTTSDTTISLRINSLKSGSGADDFCLCLPHIKSHIYLVYPKVDTIHDIKELEKLLLEQIKLEPYTKLNVPISLILDIESALAFVNLKEIAHYARFESELFELKGLIFGSIDYIKSIGQYPQFYATEYLDVPRCQLAQIARAYDILSIDMITDEKDMAIVKAETVKAYNMGYTSKLSLNQHQNKAIQESMIPPKTVIQWAEDVVRKFELAIKDKKKSIEHEGKMIGTSMYSHAKKIIEHYHSLYVKSK